MLGKWLFEKGARHCEGYLDTEDDYKIHLQIKGPKKESWYW